MPTTVNINTNAPAAPAPVVASYYVASVDVSFKDACSAHAGAASISRARGSGTSLHPSEKSDVWFEAAVDEVDLSVWDFDDVGTLLCGGGGGGDGDVHGLL